MQVKLFCWCGNLQDYSPPVVLLILIAAFILGTVGNLLGWSDPAAPTIRPPKVEENVEESVKVDDIAKLSVNEKEEVEIKVEEDVKVEKKERKSRKNKEEKKSEIKEKITEEKKKIPNDTGSYKDFALSADRPKQRSSKNLDKKHSSKSIDLRNSLEKEPDFLEDDIELSRPKLDPTISYKQSAPVSNERPSGTRIGSFHGEVRSTVKKSSSSSSFSENKKSLPRNTSPVRTRSPPKNSVSSGGERPKPRNASPKRPTTPNRSQRNSADQESSRTRWGGVQPENSHAGPVLVTRPSTSPMRPPSSSDLKTMSSTTEMTL